MGAQAPAWRDPAREIRTRLYDTIIYRVGHIHYVDPDEKDRRKAGRSHPVYLRSSERGWVCLAEGVIEKDLPPAEKDLRDGFAAAKKFIRSRGGTSLKHPKAVITDHILKNTEQKARDRRIQARAKRDSN